MKNLIVIALLSVGLAGCIKNSGIDSLIDSRAVRSCGLLVKRDHPSCQDIKKRSMVKTDVYGRTIEYDVCGITQVYEYGMWCRNCSCSCRRAGGSK